MRRHRPAALLLPVLLLGALAPAGGAAPGDGPDGGIHWETDLEAGLGRAAREGRPVLLAVNALETEAANQRLATDLYRREAWGEATREWVAFVGNPGTHAQVGAPCGRYGALPCASHQDVLRFVVRRFAPDGSLISPQHLVLEPDGDLAFRKEYFTGVVGPAFFERWLSRIAPNRAYARAGREREARIEALLAGEVDAAVAQARAWLASDDGLAVVGVLNAMDLADGPRRVALAGALDATPSGDVVVAAWAAEDACGDPDLDPELALALAAALRRADPATGARLHALLALRTEDEELRRRALQAWVGGGAAGPAPAAVPEPERDAWREVLALRGDARADDGLGATPGRRLARALALGGVRPRAFPSLVDALATGAPADVRGALLEAEAEEVRAAAVAVRAALEREEDRVAVAAAVALWRAGLGDDPAVRARLEAVRGDPVEGLDPAVRAALETLAEAGR